MKSSLSATPYDPFKAQIYLDEKRRGEPCLTHDETPAPKGDLTCEMQAPRSNKLSQQVSRQSKPRVVVELRIGAGDKPFQQDSISEEVLRKAFDQVALDQGQQPSELSRFRVSLLNPPAGLGEEHHAIIVRGGDSGTYKAFKDMVLLAADWLPAHADALEPQILVFIVNDNTPMLNMA